MAKSYQIELFKTDKPKPAPSPVPVVQSVSVPSMPLHSSAVPEWIRGLLRTHQVPVAGQLITGFERFNALLDASDMGTGKTYDAVATCAAKARRPVVIARRAAFSSWKKVLAYFGYKPEDYIITNYEMVRTGRQEFCIKDKYRAGNNRLYDCFRWKLPKDATILFDECHWMRKTGTLTEKLSLAATAQKVPALHISATVGNDPRHMRALGYALGLHNMKDYYEWMIAHGVSKGKFDFEFNCGMPFWSLFKKKDGKWVEKPDGIAELTARRLEVMGKIHQQIFGSGRGVRLRKADIPGFPTAQILPMLIDFENGTAAIRDNFARIQARMDEAGLAGSKREQMELERLKLDYIVDETQDLLDQGFHVPIFVNFNETVDELCRRLKTNCCVRGGQSQDERDRYIDGFQADEEPVIICNNMAGGESISLHDLHGNYPRVSLALPTFWAEIIRQVTGRTARDGCLTPAVVKIIFAAGTQEEDQCRTIEAKWNNIDMLNDGDLRGQTRIIQ